MAIKCIRWTNTSRVGCCYCRFLLFYGKINRLFQRNQ